MTIMTSDPATSLNLRTGLVGTKTATSVLHHEGVRWHIELDAAYVRAERAREVHLEMVEGLSAWKPARKGHRHPQLESETD